MRTFDDHLRANPRTGEGELWAGEPDKIQHIKECLGGTAFELVLMRTQGKAGMRPGGGRNT
jgi:hypothetical protein